MKASHRMATEDAWALLRRAPALYLAGLDARGRPLLRALHMVELDGALLFHGSPRGEKVGVFGREVVVSAHELVAEIPSYFVDPRRACPATTYYESVELRGRVEEVTGAVDKARALQALMVRFQREGGHAPIRVGAPEYDALYRKAVDGLQIGRVVPSSIVGKRKLGQERAPEYVLNILEGLWARGRPGDAAALERVRAAHPAAPTPTFLRGPAGLSLCSAPAGEGDLQRALELVRGTYWNEGVRDEAIVGAHRASPAWVGARDGEGRLVATARAISDRRKHAWVLDVAVAAALRGRGVGRAVLELLLAHPNVRRARTVQLKTRDAQGFYQRIGFVEREPGRMVLERAAA